MLCLRFSWERPAWPRCQCLSEHVDDADVLSSGSGRHHKAKAEEEGWVSGSREEG
jgi:hypothetical protein